MSQSLSTPTVPAPLAAPAVPGAPAIPGVVALELVASGPGTGSYRGRDATSGRPVTVSVYPPADPAALRRAVEALRALPADPGLAPPRAVGTLPDGTAYVLADPAGEPYAPEAGALPAVEWLAVGTALAAALHRAHGAGVLHRAIRPECLCRGTDGPLLTGFALPVPAAPGEPDPFLAPEARTRGGYSARSDVYALAASLWYLLTGSAPGGLDDSRDPVERELRKAMAPRPGERHPSAAAFARALETVAAGLEALPSWSGPSAGPPPRHQPVARPAPYIGRAAVEPHQPLATVQPAPQPITVQPAPQPITVQPAPRPETVQPARSPESGMAYPIWPQPAVGITPVEGTVVPSRAGTRRRRTLAVVAVVCVVAAVAAGAWAALPDRATRLASTPPGATPAVTQTVAVTTDGGPTQVRLTDGGGSVTLDWHDPTSGTAQFAVLGGPRGSQPVLQQVVGQGLTHLTLYGINPQVDYCFVVAAIYAQAVARSAAVCTSR